MSKQCISYLIIGAGPAGLGAGFRLKDLGVSDYLILERNETCGGLATSFLDNAGFTWDIGGHVQFSHYDYFDKALDSVFKADEWLHHQRVSAVWLKDRFIPYPFQNNIGSLPKEQMWECLKGLIDVVTRPCQDPPANFQEWIASSFGAGIANLFMNPYNEKVWAYPPEELSYQWIGERVAVVDLKRICQNILFNKEDTSWGPNNTFRFPLRGGTGAIWERIAKYLGEQKIRYNSTVVKIDPRKKEVHLGDGSRFCYQNLLSTMPLSVLTDLVQGFPKKLTKKSKELLFSSTHVIGLGLEGGLSHHLRDKCWLYFPESDFPFYRMTVFSRYSPFNVPDITKQYSLMCEVSESSYRRINSALAVQHTYESLVRAGLVNPKDKVVSKWYYTTAYGYPTPSCSRDLILSAVIPALEEREVYSRGRFGGWKYEVSNQDHTFMQGVEWVNKVVSNQPEVTFRWNSSDDPNLSVLRSRRKLRR